MIRRIAKKLLPVSLFNYLKRKKRRHDSKKYFSQSLKKLKYGNYNLLVPEMHLINYVNELFYLRDMNVAITAKFVAEKYGKISIIDIGANIGDTAALISSQTQSSKLVLVEASDYFFDILQKNIALFPNETVLHKSFVSDGSVETGEFDHWGGTAMFDKQSKAQKFETVTLEQIADGNTKFIKSDTDGFDFKILSHSIDWITSRKIPVLYEVWLPSAADLNDANRLTDEFYRKGYTKFVLWDNNGFLVLAGEDAGAIKDLNEYLYKVNRNEATKTISNLDLLVLHKDDEDIYQKIIQWYREN